MRLLPYDSFQIETDLPLEKAAERLGQQVDQHHLAWLLKSSYHTYEYRGQVNINEFKIRRNKRFNRNSFLPLITGSFHRVGSSTVIHVEIGPRPIEVLFTILWFCGACIALLAGLSSLFGNGFSEGALAFVIFPLIMLIGGALGTSFAFRDESNRQKTRLGRIFKGKEIKPT